MRRIGASARLLRVSLVVAAGATGLALLQGWPHPVARQRWTRIGTRALARAVLDALHVQVRVLGPRPPRAALFVANHLSWIEVLALLSALPDTRLVSKQDLGTWPLIGAVARAMGVVFVDRSRRTDVRRVIPAMIEALRAGESVLFFPEGTTSEGATVLPFRSSLFEAAIRVGAPVVPIGVRLRVLGATTATARTLCWTGDTSLLSHVPHVARVRRSVCVLRLDDPLEPARVAVDCRRTRSCARKAIATAARLRIVRSTQPTGLAHGTSVPSAVPAHAATRATAEATARVAPLRRRRRLVQLPPPNHVVGEKRAGSISKN